MVQRLQAASNLGKDAVTMSDKTLSSMEDKTWVTPSCAFKEHTEILSLPPDSVCVTGYLISCKYLNVHSSSIYWFVLTF